MISSVEILHLQPRHIFRISRGAKAEVRNVIFKLSHASCIGLGEASPNAFYHETADDVATRLASLSSWLAGITISNADDIISLWPAIWQRVQPSRAAACAVDLALWDWLAQTKSVTLPELLWNEPARPVVSCVTLGLSDPAELAAKLAELAGFPLLKIKLNRENPLELVSKIRERTSSRLVVDANAAWDAPFLAQIAPQLAALGVEFIEQPLPPGADFATTPLPIFADESCVIPEDIDRLPEAFSGFNIKLVKCGGITPALEMLRRGQQRGLRTMTGCMLETSVLISAGFAIAQRTEYADLDGAWLLQSEPFGRVKFSHGILTLS
ncbi:MAG: dipeptide epimerase [Chthoniobacterales bacterium]